LGTIARREEVDYDETTAHRADYDADVLSRVYENMSLDGFGKGIYNLEDFNKFTKDILHKSFEDHITIYAKNQTGLKKLYEIISDSNVKYFNKTKKKPSYPLSELLVDRENILLGSSCDNGLI
jgi:DNA polymerase-3 subunit alpha (Gram-positive type)